MRSLVLCIGCEELDKIYDCDVMDDKIIEKRLSGFKCLLADRRMFTQKHNYEKKSCPKDCKYQMEQMILSQKKI